MEARICRSHEKNMDTGEFTARWFDTFLRVAGLRLGFKPLPPSLHGLRLLPAWSWSWRGVEVDLWRIRFYAGWLARLIRYSC